MQLIPASDLTFPLIQAFIEPYEHTCVQLASFIRKKSPNIQIIAKNSSIHTTEEILGILYFDKSLLHCIPNLPQNDSDKAELSKLILNFLDNKQIKCINGEQIATNFFLELLNSIGIQAYQSNHYKLMTLEQIPFDPPENLSCDDEIRRCYDNDFDSLFELQKKYIIKEVAPVGKQVSDAECSISLRQILKNQLCFALFSDDQVVAKANTNAIGFNWVQIGGVYTHPLYRKNYYGWNLVNSLCKRIQKTNRKVCLFVKDKNNPALSLYTRIGFTPAGFYEICYF